jgi:hypothetical protein
VPLVTLTEERRGGVFDPLVRGDLAALWAVGFLVDRDGRRGSGPVRHAGSVKDTLVIRHAGLRATRAPPIPSTGGL